MRTGNIGGIQGGRRPETGERPKPTVIHCSRGGDQQEREFKGLYPLLLYTDDLAVVADTDMEIRRRIQSGASAWMKVEDVMGDRHISRKL